MEALRAENNLLRNQVRAAQAEIARQNHIIAAMTLTHHVQFVTLINTHHAERMQLLGVFNNA